MADYCSKCGKKLGILSGKYKTEDGSVMCGSCLKKWKDAQIEKKKKLKEKNRKIMRETIAQYLANKDVEFLNYILSIDCSEYFYNEFVKMSRERHPRKEYSETEGETRSIHLAVLNKAIEERPECVEELKEFIVNYRPYSSESKKDLSYDEIMKEGFEALAKIEAKEEDREARRPQTIENFD